MLTLDSLMLDVFKKELCPHNIHSNPDLYAIILQSDQDFSRWPWACRCFNCRTNGKCTDSFSLAFPKVWHWICEKKKGDHLCSCLWTHSFIEPIVPSLFFVSHSALLSVFVAFSVPGPLLCRTVRLRPYGTNCFVPQLYAFVWMTAGIVA